MPPFHEVVDELYPAVPVEGELLTPRQCLTTADYAMPANDADMLEGYVASELDQSAHVSDTGNPPGVTAAQTGALAASNYSGKTLPDMPDGISTGTDDGIPPVETAPTLTQASVKDRVSWGELTGIPCGFSDGVDNPGLRAG